VLNNINISKITLLGIKPISAFLLYYCTILIANKTDQKTFGQYIYIINFINLFSICNLWGIDKETIRETPFIRNNHNKSYLLLWKNLYTASLIGLPFGVMQIYYLHILTPLHLSLYSYVIISITTLSITLGKISNNWKRGLGNIIYADVVLNIARPFLFLSFIMLADFTFSLNYYINTFLISWIGVTTLSMRRSNHTEYSIKKSSIIKIISLNRIYLQLSKNTGLLKVTLLYSVITGMPLLFIGNGLGMEMASIFGACTRISSVLTMSLVAFNSSIAPLISIKYDSKNPLILLQLIRNNNKWVSIIVGLGFLVIFVKAEFLLGMFGDEYKKGGGILKVLLLGQLVDAFCGPVLLLCNILHLEKTAIKAYISVFIFEIICLYLSTNYDSLYFFAYTEVLTKTLLNIFLAIIVIKNIKINPTVLNLIKRKNGS
jgi:O-antigen/teichoic acid export membrane protein